MLQFGARAPQQARVQIEGCGPCPAEALMATKLAANTRQAPRCLRDRVFFIGLCIQFEGNQTNTLEPRAHCCCTGIFMGESVKYKKGARMSIDSSMNCDGSPD